MKKSVSKKIADLALLVTKANVNSNCWYIAYQPKLPKSCEKLKKNN